MDVSRSRSDQELKQIAKDLVADKIFTLSMLHSPELVGVVFMPLVFLGAVPEHASAHEKAAAEVQKQEFYGVIEQGGTIFEYIDKAGPRSVNGYPIFFTFQVLTKDEVDKVQAYADRVRTAVNAI